MLQVGNMELLTTSILLIVGITFWPPRRRDFPRRGWEPGFLNLKVWLARVYFFFRGHTIVKTAYQEAKDSPYLLQTLIQDVLVVPPKYLPELRMLPGTKLSASDALVAGLLGQYSGVDVILKDRQAYDVTKVRLTKSLRKKSSLSRSVERQLTNWAPEATLLPELSRKAEQILLDTLATCTTSDHVEIKVQDVISELVLRTTLLSFVGPQLADDTKLHSLVNAHVNLVRDIAIYLLFVPGFLRGWVAPFLPPSFRMRRLHQGVREILFNKKEHNKRGRIQPGTLLHHMVSTSETVDERDLVFKLLVLIGAALHTMNMSTIHALIDLCAYPEHVDDLRNEITLHLPSSAPPWSFDTINRLKALDAFLKESQRFNTPNYLSFDRLAMAPIPLSTGLTIPKGTYICLSAGSMAMDPSYYPSPTLFSPERFGPSPTAPHSTPDHRSTINFVDTESGNVHWGSGRFTCPGRWYASAVMKVFIALVVTRYDIKFPESQTERLPNVYMDILVEPNPKQKILFKRRG